MSCIERESANAQRRYQQITNYRKPLQRIINSLYDDTEDEIIASVPVGGLGGINQKLAVVAMLYGKECAATFDSFSKSMRVLMATKKELVRYNSTKATSPIHSDRSPRSTTTANRCFGCANAFVGHCLVLLSQLAEQVCVAEVVFLWMVAVTKKKSGCNQKDACAARCNTRAAELHTTPWHSTSTKPHLRRD